MISRDISESCMEHSRYRDKDSG